MHNVDRLYLRAKRETRAANKKELVNDLIVKAKQVEYLINSLPEPEPEEVQACIPHTSLLLIKLRIVSGKATRSAPGRNDTSQRGLHTCNKSCKCVLHCSLLCFSQQSTRGPPCPSERCFVQDAFRHGFRSDSWKHELSRMFFF